MRERKENKRTGEVTQREFDVEGHDWQVTYDVIKDGAVIGSASGLCSRSEATWAQRDEYAVRGMAQTRAESRSMRAVAAWVMAMAGYSTTPSEEMPRSPAADEDDPPAEPTWAAEASAARKRQALDALAFLIDPAGDDPSVEQAGGARRLATQVLTEVGEQLGRVPEAVALVLARAAGALQRAIDEPAHGQNGKAAPPIAATDDSSDSVQIDFAQLGAQDEAA